MRYPIGTQHFRTLREDGAVYVDKTEHICRVCDAGTVLLPLASAALR